MISGIVNKISSASKARANIVPTKLTTHQTNKKDTESKETASSKNMTQQLLRQKENKIVENLSDLNLENIHSEKITKASHASATLISHYVQSQLSNSSGLVVNKQVTTEVTTKLIEAGRFVDEPEYRMDAPKRGVALLINNKRFDARLELSTREGTDKDAASLEFSLSKLGFDLKVAHNCTASFMREWLFKWARADHSNYDCFLCVIMSHGEEGVVYGVDKSIELDQLIQPFKSNRTLAGKPKLFFIQACRGSNFMEGTDSNPFEINYVNKIPMEADFLFAYSTISGYFSWRNSTNGSWFIQALCHVLNENGKQLELMQILTAVNRRVAYYYESNANEPHMSGKKQIPCIVSMLTKELYFRPKSSNKKL